MMDERIDILLPPRVRMSLVADATGSYPTTRRTGDPDRQGNYAVFFDDLTVVVFSTGVQINLPTGLPPPSFVAGTLMTQLSSSLTTTGNVRPGISDEFVTYTPGEKLRPFTDSSRLWQGVQSADPFYATGSRVDEIGMGFSSPLSSKTVIEVSVSPQVPYTAGIHNGGLTSSLGVSPTKVPGNWVFDGQSNYPMMYYNFSGSKWEGVGRGLPTSITGTQGYLYGNNPQLSQEQNVRDQLYGFSPSYAITSSVEGRQAGLPMSDFGFPLHPKFHATASQLLDMSALISHPFAVEKVVYEFSASYRLGSIAVSPVRTPVSATDFTTYQNSFSGSLARVTLFTDQTGSVGDTNDARNLTFAAGDWGAPISTFFILNQRRPFNAVSRIDEQQLQPHDNTYGTAADFATANQSYPLPSRSLSILLPSSTQVSSGGSSVYVNTVRDIVTFAQVTPFLTATTDANAALLARDLNITQCSVSSVSSDTMWAGSFVMSASVRTPVVNEKIAYMYAGINDTAAVIYTFNKPGGRAGTGLPSGRDIGTSVLGHTDSASYTVNDAGFTVQLTPGRFNFKNDPYILLPTDKLVLGWQVPMGKRMFAEGRVPNVQGTVEGRASELTMLPGKGKLLLYGSLVRGASELHQTTNQPLTSISVHEALVGDPVVDEFATSPRPLQSGSYRDDYVTGSLTAGYGSRAVVASVVSSGSVNALFGLTLTDGQEARARVPGFIRGVTLVSENERFFDTLMPRIDQIATLDGSAVFYHGTFNHVVLGLDSNYSSVPSGTTTPVLVAIDGTTYPNVVADATWDRAFPYEPRYSTVQRDVDVVSNTMATRTMTAFGPYGIGDAIAKPIFRKLTVSRAMNWGESLSPTFPVLYLQEQLGDSTDGVFPSTPRDVLLHLYGVGTAASGTITHVTHWASRSLGPFGNDNEFKSVFRGFKYGILNALPEFSRAVYRASSYGQLRDTLEQRLDSKFYDTVGLNADGSRGGRTGPTASPVQVKFVEPRTVIVTSPRLTFCSNLSVEATSSMPYFDGRVTNREDPLDLTQLNSTLVSF